MGYTEDLDVLTANGGTDFNDISGQLIALERSIVEENNKIMEELDINQITQNMPDTEEIEININDMDNKKSNADTSTAKNNSTMFNYQYNLVFLLFKIVAIIVTFYLAYKWFGFGGISVGVMMNKFRPPIEKLKEDVTQTYEKSKEFVDKKVTEIKENASISKNENSMVI
jgi:hypothetical protein